MVGMADTEVSGDRIWSTITISKHTCCHMVGVADPQVVSFNATGRGQPQLIPSTHGITWYEWWTPRFATSRRQSMVNHKEFQAHMSPWCANARFPASSLKANKRGHAQRAHAHLHHNCRFTRGFDNNNQPILQLATRHGCDRRRR